jgi:hypothetical protein
MNKLADVAEWCDGATEEYGDASVPVCQLFFRWAEASERATEYLACWLGPKRADGLNTLLLLLPNEVISLPINHGGMLLSKEGVEAYGVQKIAPGIWSLSPSLNVEYTIHAFVVLHGVPDPAPWERLVLLASECMGKGMRL